MKVLITGGHMGPAVAVIEALPKGIDVVYVGRMHSFEGDKGFSLEYQTITKMGIPFIPLTTGRVQRVFTPHTLPSLLKIPRGFWEAVRILRKEKPDVILGFGGYLSFPIGVAGKLLGIPLVIHEQIRKAGMANQLLSIIADKICISWETSKAYFPQSKVVLTGNPLLPFNKETSLSFPSGKAPLLVIVGGSAGSHALNVLVEGSLLQLLPHYRIFHQTGEAVEFGDFQRLQKIKSDLPPELQGRYKVVTFIPPASVWGVLDKADGVVSRSGINTITMLLVLQKKSLLIPLPYGQKNEQLENALFLKKEGIAHVFDQQSATPSSFVQAITAMMEMKGNRHLANYKHLHVNAAEKIAEVIQLCATMESKKEKTASL